MNTHSTSATHGVAKHNIFANRWGALIAHDAPDDKGAADEAAKAAAKEIADKAAADAAAAAAKAEADKNKPSDDAAKLLKEVMEKKAALTKAEADKTALAAQLAAFGGVDPEAVKALLKEKADADKAALEKAGDFERVKKMMADEHAAKIKELEDKNKALESEGTSAKSTINEMTIGQAFLASAFIKDELVLPASKARLAYGDHFELENGNIVAFDKPKGQSERTKLVDAAGSPMSFEAALARLVEKDPDKDAIKRSKMQPGSSLRPGNTDAKPDPKISGVTGVNRIKAALEAKAAEAAAAK